MRKLLISVSILLIIPAAVYAGFNFGLVKATKRIGDKVDEKVVQNKITILRAHTPTIPANLTAVVANSTQINLNWTASTDDVGVSYYKIYRNNGTTPIATPISTTYSDTGLITSTIYSYTVSACDAVGNCSANSTAASGALEWILVPGSATIGTSDFYVMKYEAKNVGGVATSQADVTPWVYIDLPAAAAACSALGAGYHLLTIAEVQTINRNIEAQPANWANGVVGSLVTAGGGLKRGNVGITDSVSYGGGTAAEYGANRNTKAKHVLSNGGEIWDWSGNVLEWVYGAGVDGTLSTPNGVTFNTGGPYAWNNAILNEERPILGPSNNNWDETYGVGSYADGRSNGASRRGGYYAASGEAAGVFAFCATNNLHDPIGVGGFRCSK